MLPLHQDNKRDGISIEDRWKARGAKLGKRYLAKVRDTRLQRYKRKAFVELESAKSWARTTRARLELSETSAGTWPIADVLEDCLRTLRQEGRRDVYIHEVERHGRLLEKVKVNGASLDHRTP